jgi:hypothetical protein
LDGVPLLSMAAASGSSRCGASTRSPCLVATQPSGHDGYRSNGRAQTDRRSSRLLHLHQWNAARSCPQPCARRGCVLTSGASGRFRSARVLETRNSWRRAGSGQRQRSGRRQRAARLRAAGCPLPAAHIFISTALARRPVAAAIAYA